MNSKIIISINAFHFLATEYILKSCERLIKDDYFVILNCSEDFYKEINNSNLIEEPSLIVNPEVINKGRHHGSLLQGIVSNMNLALRDIENWQYFINLSNRTVLSEEINLQKLNSIPSLKDSPRFTCSEECEEEFKIKNKRGWHWNSEIYSTLPIGHLCSSVQGFIETKFSKKFREQRAISSPHEGLTLDKQCVSFVSQFMNEEKIIANELYQWNGALEEFVIHQLSCNSGGRYIYSPIQKLEWKDNFWLLSND